MAGRLRPTWSHQDGADRGLLGSHLHHDIHAAERGKRPLEWGPDPGLGGGERPGQAGMGHRLVHHAQERHRRVSDLAQRKVPSHARLRAEDGSRSERAARAPAAQTPPHRHDEGYEAQDLFHALRALRVLADPLRIPPQERGFLHRGRWGDEVGSVFALGSWLHKLSCTAYYGHYF